MARPLQRLGLAVTLVAALAKARDARADEAPDPPYEASVGAVALAGFPPHGEATVDYGAGASYSYEPVPSWALEVVVHFVASRGEAAFPTDFLGRKSFYPSRYIHPYVGLGLTLIPEIARGEGAVGVGLASSWGTDLWLSEPVGVFAEANANLVLLHGDVVPELGGVAGPVFRWR